MKSCNKQEIAKRLRENTGADLANCMRAVERTEGDYLLAEGYLKYYGCAIATKQPHEEWVMDRARKYKEDKLQEG